ncbi:hypothetical protein, conserved [Eimeria tenella]|uniref:Uncharacterized protein n=2 Tax=Eimeria tenella TaxID=5802 RepID=U6KX07_EIMTE|nr:hypothetical protein, conserved [Eimeria tenella]CDJ42486.1 hypothetical protein, conserved [Eimeria tenella]|eukprot:XP_013233236.1 hypothetical protein, conserved [Eimeria tenella]
MKVLVSSVAMAGAVALCAASSMEMEAPVEYYSAVTSEQIEDPTGFEAEAEDGHEAAYSPEMEGLGAEEEMEEGVMDSQVDDEEDEDEEGAEKRELCHGYKCKKAKGKGKYYKYKKAHYKKNKYASYVVPQKAAVAAVPAKTPPVPTKYVAPAPSKYVAPPPQKFSAAPTYVRAVPQKAAPAYVVRAPAKYSGVVQPAQSKGSLNNNILQRLMLQPSSYSQGKQG